jgi:outer membrane protein TolC
MNMVCNWRNRLAASTAALVAALAPEGAAAEVVTLQELEEQALANQARWAAVEAATAEADAEVRAARAQRMPSFWMNVMGAIAPGSDIERVLTTDGREVNVRASPTVREATAFRPNARYEGTIDMRAPLYDGQTRASLKAAEAYRDAALASADASRETVLAMVRAAYLDWLATHLDHGFALSAATDATQQRERSASRVDDGERPPSELDTARYQELQAELAASDAAARLDAARRLLESAVGTELAPDAAPDTALLSVDAGATPLEKKWEIQALELRRDAARREAEMHRKARVPVIAVIGRTGIAGVNERVFPMYQLGLNLSVPLWDGGRAISLAHAAEARAVELDALARDARLERTDERTEANVQCENAEAQLVIADALVSVSEKRVGQAEASYDLGAADLEAVADARAALREAQSRRVQIQVARADAVLRLRSE